MKYPEYDIVLLRPEIPQNTGNIGRICVSTESRLHLIGPLGFSLDDKYVRRAGMDYWKNVKLHLYDSWEDFLRLNPEKPLYFFSTKTEKIYWDCPLEENAFLVFGNESSGLPEDFYSRYSEHLYTIPMPGKYKRSLNLANSVALVLYEGMRRSYLKGTTTS